MPERSPVLGSALLLLAALLVAVAGWAPDSLADDLGNSLWAVVGSALWLAQVPAALGMALLRGSRGRAGLWADAGRLAVRWAATALVTLGLLGGPLWLLLAQPSLAHSLLLSAMAGLLLIMLWWQWPRWQQLEALGAVAAAGVPPRLERKAWRGLLQVALPLFLLLVGGLLLAWPGVLPGPWRLFANIGYLCGLPVAHGLLQAAVHWLAPQPVVTALHGLPIVEMEIVEMEDAASLPDVARPVPIEAEPAPEAIAPPHPAPPIRNAAAPLPVDEAGQTMLARQLQQAARNGRVERALALLAAGANPLVAADPDARDRRSVAVLAAVLPDLRLLRALIERGVDVNAMQDGITPLLAATRDSWHGRPEAVMTLLTNGADPKRADADGNTPLHHAARSSDPGVAALLRDAGADLNALNREGVSPLGSACAAGNWRLARFLLERGAQTDVAGGQPALSAAAGSEEDDPAGVQLLLRHKARVNARDAVGRSALHEAAAANHVEICRILLAAGAEANAKAADGRTPLLEAVHNGALLALEVLLEAGADVHAKDAAGASALHLACTADPPIPELVGDLRDLGLDPHAEDAQGRSSLDLAEAAGRWTLVGLLDPRRALPVALADESDSDERPPLLQLRQALLDGASLPRLEALAVAQEPRDFDTLLVDAEVTASPSRLHWLLRHGANPEACLPASTLPVPAALAQGLRQLAQLQLLFAFGASPAGRGGLATFLAACAVEPGTAAGESVALQLLERGADPFGAGPTGAPPLVHAVRLGWDGLILRLLAMGVDPEARDARGMGALHHATLQGRKQVVKWLVAHGAGPDRRAADGQTPQGIALAAGQRDLLVWLDWRQWRLPHRALQSMDMPAAAISGDLDAVRRLLELGFSVDAVDAQGCTALLRASGSGHRALVEYLLSVGASPEVAASTGATPLSAAVSKRHLDIVTLLLRAGSSTERRLPGDVTVLMLAAALGLPEVVSQLLQAGANLQVQDAQGLTPLHCAALYGFTERDRSRLMALLDALLLAGADPHRAANNGATPLLLLLGARTEPGTPSNEDVLLAGLERLLDEEVQLDVRDARGYGPLHLAAQHGLQRVALRLLQAGADPLACDNAGRTPRDLAQLRGYVEIAAQLGVAAAPTGSPLSMARFLRE